MIDSQNKAPESGAFLLSPEEKSRILRAVYAAGEAILSIYAEPFRVEHKPDDSPLTAADRASHSVLDSVLSQTPYPVFSEEGVLVPYDVRKSWDYYWLIDPLDGTKEFIKKNGEFTVNVALIHKGKALLGIVYAPVLGWLYWGEHSIGAFKASQRVEYAALVTDDHRLKRLALPKKLTVVASRSHVSAETEALLEEWGATYGPVECINMGSSLKICLVAEGKAHAYPRLAPTMEWDTAAGQAVAEASGCQVFAVELVDGRPVWKNSLSYNKPDPRNPWFLVCGAPYLCGHA